METSVRIRDDADWVAAGAALVQGLAGLDRREDRLELVNRCCLDFGDNLYPAFLKLLCAIGRFGEPAARALVADTLAEAIATARLPSGRMAAWGGLGPAVGHPGAPPPGRAVRSFGPVEYLCTWHMEGRGEMPLDEETFATACRLLATLIGASPQATEFYSDKLQQDASDPLDGTYSRSTRQLLDAFARGLQAGRDPDSIASDVIVRARSIRANQSRGRWEI